MENFITYRQEGDYLVPNIKFPDLTVTGKYANLRKQYLMNHKKALFSHLLMEETLVEHCNGIGEKAQQMEDDLVEQMAKTEGLTEELKATDQMKWVGLMNAILQAAEEIVLTNLIYT